MAENTITLTAPLKGYIHRKGLIPRLARWLDRLGDNRFLFRIGWQECNVVTSSNAVTLFSSVSGDWNGRE